MKKTAEFMLVAAVMICGTGLLAGPPRHHRHHRDRDGLDLANGIVDLVLKVVAPRPAVVAPPPVVVTAPPPVVAAPPPQTVVVAPPPPQTVVVAPPPPPPVIVTPAPRPVVRHRYAPAPRHYRHGGGRYRR